MSNLHQQCVDDLTSQITGDGRNLEGVGSSAILALVPIAVQTTIDFAVQAGGPAIHALVIAAKPEIRQFISSSALAFLDSVVNGLKDVKAAN